MTTQADQNQVKHKLIKLCTALGTDHHAVTKLIDERLQVWNEKGFGIDPHAEGTSSKFITDLTEFVTVGPPELIEHFKLPQVIGNGDNPPPVRTDPQPGPPAPPSEPGDPHFGGTPIGRPPLGRTQTPFLSSIMGRLQGR
jgi:hypothetical protein